MRWAQCEVGSCERWRIVERAYGPADAFRCSDVGRSCKDPEDTARRYCGRKRTGAVRLVFR